ncbi:MAG: hypothetical protein ACLTKT_01870 [Clostridia bacterium]
MSYFSNVMIAVTKQDFEKIENEQKKIPYNILLEDIKVENYKENNMECVFVHFGYIQYKKEFEEVQLLEKSLKELKDGYVFCRLGEETMDIEFKKRTKLSELMTEFEFIKELSKSLNKELKKEEEEEFE